MEMTFKGKLNSISVVDRSTGVIANAVVSAPLFEIDVDAFFKYLPSKKIKLEIKAGNKNIAEMECEMKGAREAISKEGTHLYAAFQGKLTEEFIKRAGTVVGEQLDFMISMDTDDQPQQDLKDLK